MQYRILLIDDDASFQRTLIALLNTSEQHQFLVDASSANDINLTEVLSQPYDIYLLNERFDQETLPLLDQKLYLPVIFLTQVSIPSNAIFQYYNIDYLCKQNLSAELAIRCICYTIEQTKNREKLQQLSLYDDLTKIPNRRHFQTQLGKTIAISARKRKPFSLLFINIDRFKTINDALGQQWGDECLIRVGKLLQTIASGDFIARLGSDEFAIIITNKESSYIDSIAETIITALEDPTLLNGKTVMLNTSIGISHYPQDGITDKDLLKAADSALRTAKAYVGSQIVRFEENHKTLEASWVESELPTAIKENQLFLEYQAQVHTKTRQCIGAEALCRWQHPEKGKIAPDQFIPVIEKTPIIHDLGLWVLREVCKNIDHIKAMFGNEQMTVSINISMTQFNQKSFIDDVTSIIKEYGVTPQDLEFELTESTLIHQPEQVIEKLNHLKDFGVHFAIDDFGTGYSSLAYLVDLPIHVLKIDRCFTKDFINNKKKISVIRAIIALSKSLQLTTVAEGVEEAQSANYLMSLGCDVLQGYFIGRPTRLTDSPERLSGS